MVGVSSVQPGEGQDSEDGQYSKGRTRQLGLSIQPEEGQDSEDGQYSQGKLGLSQVSRLTLKAGIKIFGPQTNFQVYIYDPSEPFF